MEKAKLSQDIKEIDIELAKKRFKEKRKGKQIVGMSRIHHAGDKDGITHYFYDDGTDEMVDDSGKKVKKFSEPPSKRNKKKAKK
jgi:hypothetical protein